MTYKCYLIQVRPPVVLASCRLRPHICIVVDVVPLFRVLFLSYNSAAELFMPHGFCRVLPGEILLLFNASSQGTGSSYRREAV